MFVLFQKNVKPTALEVVFRLYIYLEKKKKNNVKNVKNR